MDQNRQQQLDEPLAELDNPRWTRARVVERSGAVLIVDGVREYTIAEAAREAGIPAAALRTRLHQRWSVHEALKRPLLAKTELRGAYRRRGT
jgi:hypothetical protein